MLEVAYNTPEMNEKLLEEFREEEVRFALSPMHPTKSPSPDSMPPIFYQQYWDVVGPNVISCIMQSLSFGLMPYALNETYICLIPKAKCPQKVTKFRPISLCNVIYKIMSKVLANRLKKILPEVISEAQSAFVPRRQITNNVFVAFEMMHCISMRKKGKKRLMAVKLDMSKAYNRVEWRYLQEIMRKMGFQGRWIQLTMMCVKTVSYSVLINGEPKGKIFPTRGLHEGDPISPYLFLLCAEGLSAMFQREARMGQINGVLVCRRVPQISHLFFTDNSIIFCRPTLDEAIRVSQILKEYEWGSGQKLNKEKTSLFFSRNMAKEVQEDVKDLFGAQIIKQHEKYLGLPLLIGKGKKEASNRIKDQVGKGIVGWKCKLLSRAGREILIKVVAQATPTYTMSYFKLDSLCVDLNSMV